ncbi:MAG: hypothetical protein ACON42_05985 [Flavobacteriaceae bacterium]
MSDFDSSLHQLEQKVVALLNRLKEKHAELHRVQSQYEALESKIEGLEKLNTTLRQENKTLKVANSLLGSKESKQVAKTKINSLIQDVESCIQQFSSLDQVT